MFFSEHSVDLFAQLVQERVLFEKPYLMIKTAVEHKYAIQIVTFCLFWNIKISYKHNTKRS